MWNTTRHHKTPWERRTLAHLLPVWAYCMGVKDGLRMLEICWDKFCFGLRKRFSLFRIFCCGRFHQFVVLVIFTNTSNDSGCHSASSLYNFGKDETHGLHSPDSSLFHSSVGVGGGEPRGAALQSLTSRARRRLRCDTAALGGSQRPHPRCRGAAPRRGRRRGCCERPVGTTGNGVEGWCDAEWVKEQLGDKLFDDFIASCAQSCGGIKLIGGICCSWDRDVWNLLKYIHCTGKPETWKYSEFVSGCGDWPQRYNTNFPHAMTTFDNTFSACRWKDSARHRCQIPWDVIKHLEREELLHICYLYGPTVWVWKSAWKCLRYVETSFLRRKKTVFPFSDFSDFLLWKVPSVRSLGDLHKQKQR